jgi:hypothetical protein
LVGAYINYSLWYVRVRSCSFDGYRYDGGLLSMQSSQATGRQGTLGISVRMLVKEASDCVWNPAHIIDNESLVFMLISSSPVDGLDS